MCPKIVVDDLYSSCNMHGLFNSLRDLQQIPLEQLKLHISTVLTTWTSAVLERKLIQAIFNCGLILSVTTQHIMFYHFNK